MPADSIDSAEAKWRAQVAAMRAALADLKLPPKATEGPVLPPELESLNLHMEDDEDFTSGNSGDDVWDFISDTEEEYYSSDSNDALNFTPQSTESYGQEWLKERCTAFASRKQGLSAHDLQEQITALLASDSREDELQSTLTDIVGFDDLDFVIELISHRQSIISARQLPKKHDDGIFEGKLLTKREREEVLRQKDYEHKHAALAPHVNRDEEQYPHVYKSHSAGNFLSMNGRRYGLPVGSKETDHEVGLLWHTTSISSLLVSFLLVSFGIMN